jgi:AhpD family alkylhydroperoxidase
LLVSLRVRYWSVFPREHDAVIGALRKVAASVDARLCDLLLLRVSQINRCAYCVDLHGADALKAGESTRRLNALAVWRETPFFSERERAALGWAEHVTTLPGPSSLDEAYAALRPLFADHEIVALTFAVALMNSLNRMSIAFGRMPEVDRA